MRFNGTDEQEALRRQARQLLKQHSAPAAVRRAIELEAGWEPELWAKLVDLGWTALLVPEEQGGLGLGWVEAAAIFEEAGAALLCAPLFSTVALATNLLLLADAGSPARALLGEIAGGRLRATVAWRGSEGAGGGDEGKDGLASASARREGDRVVLSGGHGAVVDGHTAELLIVSAREPDGGVGLYVVPAASPGLQRRPRATLDLTRKLADVELAGVTLPATARLPGDGAALLGRMLDRAKVMLAAEQLGGAERCLEMAVDYAKTRVQFGRPIGSFQAVKHRCADMLVQVESARSACAWASWCADSDEAELPVAAGLARSFVSEAFMRVAGDNIQVHGGMGFTWEHDAHLYFRRARSAASLLGEARDERLALAARMGL
jgi:alkylation response protein AidB-like acyl-CoA dehydrogenase